MKNTKDFAQIVAVKKATLEVLETLMEKLAYEEEYVLFDYRKVGEEPWLDDFGNQMYYDEKGNRTSTITDKPAMKSIYDNVKKTDEEITERDKAKLAAIEKIRETLAALA